VGMGKLGQDDFIRIIEERNRSSAGNSAPPGGLSLVHVQYPDDIRL
jgi:tRNA pseudouridine38-40 synthase